MRNFVGTWYVLIVLFAPVTLWADSQEVTPVGGTTDLRYFDGLVSIHSDLTLENGAIKDDGGSLRIWIPDNSNTLLYDAGVTPRLSIVDDYSTFLYDYSGTVRLTIGSNGTVGINTASPSASYTLDIDGSLRTSDTILVSNTSPSLRLWETDYTWDWNIQVSSADLYVREYFGSANRMVFETGGDNCIGCSDTTPDYTLEVTGTAGKPGGGSWSDSSDRRLKKNIVPLTDALATITQLRGVRFEWINPEDHQSGVHAGLIAQDVEQVFPEWIDEIDPDEADSSLVASGEKIKALHFPHEFNAYLVEAIGELKDENDLLRQEIATLRQLLCLQFPDEPTCAE